MQNYMDIKKNWLLIVFIIAMFIFAFWLYKKNMDNTTVDNDTDVTPTTQAPSTANETDANAKDPANKNFHTTAWYSNTPPESRKEIDTLQELLDDEDRQTEALAKAIQMAEKGDDYQIIASIGAFTWLGGHDSMSSLAKIIKQRRGEISKYASDSLQALFQEQTIDDEQPFDTEIWKDVIKVIHDDGERNAYFVLLTSNPVNVAAPVLIDLWRESKDDEDTSDLCKEYLESMAEGKELETPEETEEWLEEFEAKQQKEEEERKAEDDGIETIEEFSEGGN